MRKTDYTLLAEIIKNRRASLLLETSSESDAEYAGLGLVAFEFSRKAHVNHTAFLKACGFDVTQ